MKIGELGKRRADVKKLMNSNFLSNIQSIIIYITFISSVTFDAVISFSNISSLYTISLSYASLSKKETERKKKLGFSCRFHIICLFL